MKLIENLSKEEYQKFSFEHSKSHFLQLYSWGEFSSSYKKQIAHYIGIKENDNLIATALILEKKTPLGYSYGYCPRGPLIDYQDKKLLKEVTYQMKQYMKDHKYIYIRFDPDIKYQSIDSDAMPIKDGFNNYELYNYLLSLGYHHTGFYKLYNGNQPRYTFRINLNNSWEDIEKKMSKSFLKTIKRSYNYDLIIDNKEVPEEIYRLIQNNSSKDDFNAHNLKYYEELTTKLNEDNAIKYFNAYIEPLKLINKINQELEALQEELKTAKKRINDLQEKIIRLEKEKDLLKDLKENKIMICSLICTYTKNHAWSFIIGNDNLANLCFAVQRCYYEAIKDSYERHYEFFDLFGTTGDPHTKYKNLAKLHDFKRKFGDEYIEFMGEFDLINNKILYRILPILLKIYRKLKK